MKTWVTVAEASHLTGKSKRLIYNLIDENRIRTETTSNGKLLHLPELQETLATRRGPGRPRKDTPHSELDEKHSNPAK